MRVLVAMSGGVDSSVAAALLAAEGHDVTGVTMRLWGGDSDTGCCSVADVDDARRVADQLGIEHRVFNFTEDFDRFVVEPYVQDHHDGRTPNPCIECNRHLKFDRLSRRAEALGFDAVATGHHARIRMEGDRWTLARGADRAKDQSYVVHPLDQRRLARTWFPLGDLTKAEVRDLAARLGLRTAAKPDSQDVCFITARGRRDFLGQRIPLRPALVVDQHGDVIGEVPAVELVTVGQRRGLSLPGGAPPQFVLDVDAPAGRVVVGAERDLLVAGQHATAMTWTDRPHRGDALVQTSAHGAARPARVDVLADGGAVVRWDVPQRRVAPGQSLVLYDLEDRRVLGGGLAGVVVTS